MYYAGIGRRVCPAPKLSVMTRFATKMQACDWTLRSGGANGSDLAFAQGTTKKEIFLAGKAEPWAFEELELCLPHYIKNINTLARYVQNTLARNMMIILGKHGDLPVSFVICYTDSYSEGGTAYGIRCARRHQIPVFNLHDEKTSTLVESFLNFEENIDFLTFLKWKLD